MIVKNSSSYIAEMYSLDLKGTSKYEKGLYVCWLLSLQEGYSVVKVDLESFNTKHFYDKDKNLSSDKQVISMSEERWSYFECFEQLNHFVSREDISLWSISLKHNESGQVVEFTGAVELSIVNVNYTLVEGFIDTRELIRIIESKILKKDTTVINSVVQVSEPNEIVLNANICLKGMNGYEY